MSNERVDRERDWHDKRFADDPRVALSRFYARADRVQKRHRQLAIEGVQGLDVLLYGCGDGSDKLTNQIYEAGGRPTGIDISDVAIKAASERIPSTWTGCSFQVMDAEALSFGDASFDRVIGSGIIHHLDLRKAFGQISRVLRPSGGAVFLEPLGINPVINWWRRRTPDMRTPDEHPLVRADLKLARSYFRVVRAEFFHCLGMAGTIFPWASGVLDKADEVLLHPRSPMRWLAWTMVLVLEK
jgi:SAM-dependent methyltransferase